MQARKEQLARLESEDSGKTITMARTVDIDRAIKNCRFFAGAVRHDRTDCHTMHDAINYTLRVPVGVALVITPWNLPLYLSSWACAAALAAGNCVILKPSELTPRTATVFGELLREAGCPPGVFQIVHGFGHRAGAPLVAHPDVPVVSFTGGTATGERIAALAAPGFKKLSLELGGKNATIVFDDADLDRAVDGALRSAFTNQGQVCLAGSRVLVQRGVYDEFVRRFVAGAAAIQVGDPALDTTRMGPVASAAHLDKIRSYLRLAETEGGVIACGGERPAGLPDHLRDGHFITPAVITGLAPTSRTSTEEIFGPVVVVHPFDADEEAVTIANNTRYGLAGSVWTSNLERAHRTCRRVHSGVLWVNCWLHRDLRTPFGGMKDSGVARMGGEHSLDFYSELKNVCIHLGSGPAPTPKELHVA